jgi:hypothetical protein
MGKKLCVDANRRAVDFKNGRVRLVSQLHRPAGDALSCTMGKPCENQSGPRESPRHLPHPHPATLPANRVRHSAHANVSEPSTPVRSRIDGQPGFFPSGFWKSRAATSPTLFYFFFLSTLRTRTRPTTRTRTSRLRIDRPAQRDVFPRRVSPLVSNPT